MAGEGNDIPKDDRLQMRAPANIQQRRENLRLHPEVISKFAH